MVTNVLIQGPAEDPPPLVFYVDSTFDIILHSFVFSLLTILNISKIITLKPAVSPSSTHQETKPRQLLVKTNNQGNPLSQILVL